MYFVVGAQQTKTEAEEFFFFKESNRNTDLFSHLAQ